MPWMVPWCIVLHKIFHIFIKLWISTGSMLIFQNSATFVRNEEYASPKWEPPQASK
jgi:hypothetical protein